MPLVLEIFPQFFSDAFWLHVNCDNCACEVVFRLFFNLRSNAMGFFYLDLFGEAAVDVNVAFALCSIGYYTFYAQVLPDALSYLVDYVS